MCSIAFRHASGEVPLDHEKNTQIIHLFPPTNRSWGKVGRGANAECDNFGETVANVHGGGDTSGLKSVTSAVILRYFTE